MFKNSSCNQKTTSVQQAQTKKTIWLKSNAKNGYKRKHIFEKQIHRLEEI